MQAFRVTKYDPKMRAPDGSFTGSEWTSVSDIGREVGGGLVGTAQYLVVEDAYVEAVARFMRASRVSRLTVAGLEKHPRDTPLRGPQVQLIEDWVARVTEGDILGEAEVHLAVRAALREQLWCRLVGERGFYVHFGYDYYMYVGTNAEGFDLPAAPSGIFVEAFESPYAPDSSQ